MSLEYGKKLNAAKSTSLGEKFVTKMNSKMKQKKKGKRYKEIVVQ